MFHFAQNGYCGVRANLVQSKAFRRVRDVLIVEHSERCSVGQVFTVLFELRLWCQIRASQCVQSTLWCRVGVHSGRFDVCKVKADMLYEHCYVGPEFNRS